MSSKKTIAAKPVIESLESRQMFDGSIPLATNLGEMTGRRSYTDWVSVTYDSRDYRRFTMSTAGQFDARLTGMSSDADLTLHRINWDGSATYIAGSYAGGTTNDSISRYLGAGTYAVGVQAYSGSTWYNLQLEADHAGDSSTQARYLGAPTGSRNFRDFVGGTDSNDWYRISVTNPGRMNLTLSGLSADADLALYRDANYNGIAEAGEWVASSTLGGSYTDSISRDVSAGQYLIRAYQYSGDTNYNLNVNVQSDNTRSGANYLGHISGSTRYAYNYVGSDDTQDFFRFTTDPGRTISVRIAGLSADADLQLMDSAGNVLASSVNGGTLSDAVSRYTATGGTFYVRVYQYSGNTNYSLSVSAF
jgi:hypothetical protein